MPDIGPAIGGGVSLISGAMGSDSSESAAQTQADSGAAAIAEQKRQYDLNRSDLAPWRDTGGAALGKLSSLLGLSVPKSSSGSAAATQGMGRDDTYRKLLTDLGYSGDFSGTDHVSFANNLLGTNFTAQDRDARINGSIPLLQKKLDEKLAAEAPPVDTATDPEFGSLMKDFTIGDFEKDPGYDFRMSEGQKALDRAAGARGGYLSGRALKEGERYAQDYASGEFDKAYNRYNTNRSTKFNMLSGVAGTGQTAVNTGVAAGSNSANNISDLYTQIGNVNAAGQVAGSNAWSTGLSSIGNMFGRSNGGGYDPSSGITWNSGRYM